MHLLANHVVHHQPRQAGQVAQRSTQVTTRSAWWGPSPAQWITVACGVRKGTGCHWQILGWKAAACLLVLHFACRQRSSSARRRVVHGHKRPSSAALHSLRRSTGCWPCSPAAQRRTPRPHTFPPSPAPHPRTFPPQVHQLQQAQRCEGAQGSHQPARQPFKVGHPQPLQRGGQL